MTPKPRLPWILLLAAAGCAAPKHTTSIEQRAPLAARSDPGLVTMTADPTTTLVLASNSSELGVRFRISAKSLPDTERPPLNLGLVLDTSGSMDGASIDAVRASARELLAKLRDGDRISIVAFDSTARVLVPTEEVTPASKARIARAIGELKARGTTALAEGLALGFQQVLAGRLAQGINRIVLVSDGVPNTSLALPQVEARIHANGLAVTTLGLGTDYDTRLMTQLALDTGGTFTYVEKPEQVADVFDHELAKMTTVVGRNLQLALEPGPGVTILPMPGLVPGSDGKVYATVGDLPAGETRDLMIPVQVAARGDGSTVELVEGTLEFEDVIGRSGHHTRDAYVGLKASSDITKVHAAVVIDLEVARVRTAAAAAILVAMNLARSGNVGAARQDLADAQTAVRAAMTRTHDATLQDVLDQLAAVSKELARVEPPPPPVNIAGQPDVDAEKPQAMAPEQDEPALRRAEERAEATVQGQP